MTDLLEWLRSDFNSASSMFTAKQKQIIKYILDHPAEVCTISLKELSRRTDCTEVTLLRVMQKLGFSGFIEFKIALRKKLPSFENEQRFVPEHTSQEESLQHKQAMLEQIIQQEQANFHVFMQTVQTQPYLDAAQLLLNTDSVLILGRGLSNSLGEFLSYRLSLLGIRSMVCSPENVNLLPGQLSSINQRTAVIVMTFPVYYPLMNQLVDYCLDRHAPLLVLTDSALSPVADRSPYTLLCPLAKGTVHNSLVTALEAINLLIHAITIQMGVGFQKLRSETQKLFTQLDSALKMDNSASPEV